MKKFVKITEGEGYIGGDYECWCINPVPFETMTRFPRDSETTWSEYLELDDKRVYPDTFVPDELETFDEPRVKYRVTFEVILVEEEQS